MKTYVFDASALFALLRNTPGAAKVNELLKTTLRGHVQIFMSAANYGEVYGRLLRDHGQERARTAMTVLRPLPIDIVDVTAERAFQAAELKSTYKLYYVDSFAAALAVERKATLVTSDSDFRRLGHAFPVVWLKT